MFNEKNHPVGHRDNVYITNNNIQSTKVLHTVNALYGNRSSNGRRSR